jgi:hypothetical protein
MYILLIAGFVLLLIIQSQLDEKNKTIEEMKRKLDTPIARFIPSVPSVPRPETSRARREKMAGRRESFIGEFDKD